MIGKDEILEETLNLLFEFHRKGHKDKLEVFNRLLFKSKYGRDPQPDERLNIQKNQIRSYKEKKTTEELREIQQSQTKKHELPVPHKGKKSPIIIVQYEGIDRLLDGSKRINKWFNEGNTEMHEVNMHEIIPTNPQ